MLNENANDTSMEDLKQLVESIINTPLSEKIEKNFDDLKWNVENTQEKIKDIGSNTKREIKKLSEESLDGIDTIKESIEHCSKLMLGGFDAIKESMEDNSKLIVINLDKRISSIDILFDKYQKESFKLMKNYNDVGLDKLKQDVNKDLYHIVNKLNDFEKVFIGKFDDCIKKIEFIEVELDSNYSDFKDFVIQLNNDKKENKKLNFGLLILGVINLIIFVVLLYLYF